MVSDRQLFTNLDKSEGGMINTSCGMSTLRIEGKGTIKLKFKNDIITFHNVLLVPKITVNVLSLRHLILEQCQINFYVNHFSILKNNAPYLEGRYQHNLPVLELEPLSQHSHLSAAEMLHKSLGNVSYRRIRQKLGIPVKAPEVCKTCAASKVTKASFKLRSSSASKPLEELHLDLIGPISTASHLKHRYILTIVDANTRFVAAIPLVSKSDVYKALTYAIDVEAKRLGYYPSTLHSDQGTEFVNSSMERYCLDHVIKQRFSDEYTPQQNGLAERFNRTILESLRTLLMDSGFSFSLWNKILSTCTLTMNQIPAHRSKKSPYKLFKMKTIPLNLFKPIGNPLIVLSNKKKSKLEP
jgi:transposase InsO family protein